MRAQIAHGGGLIQLMPSGSTRSAWITSIEGSPVDVTWLSNDGARWPRADVEEMLTGKEQIELTDSKSISAKEGGPAPTGDDEDEASMVENDVTEYDVDFSNVFNLLYPPQAVRSQIQKRTQITLLKEVCRKMRMVFNDKFEALAREKEDVISAVQALNNRIYEILGELQVEEKVYAPTLSDTEVPDSAVTVRDDELERRPYISEATLQKRRQEEEERRNRELQNSKEDAKGRALIDMMNGSLEIKRDVFAEASALQRPEWMGQIPLDLMTDAQRKEVEDFDEKFRLLQEEQNKYKKSLEIELKRLRSDIKDKLKEFNDKVERLAKVRLLTEREILSQELYMSRLALSMANQDQLRKSFIQIENNISRAESILQEKQDGIFKFEDTVNNAKVAKEHLEVEAARLLTNFPRDIKNKCGENFDHETIKKLKYFFTYRQNADREDGMDETDGTQSASNTFGFSASGTKKSSSMRSSRSKGFKRSRAKTRLHGKSRSQQNKSKLGASKAGASAKASQGGSSSRLGPMQEAALAMQEAQEELPSAIVRDPFYGVFLKQDREARLQQQAQPSTEYLDIPDDLDLKREYWAHLNELRSAHIQKQIESAAATMSFNALNKKLDELRVEESFLRQNLDALRLTRDEIVRNIHVTETDLQCLVAIRQGQDEVDKDVVVTDYSGSLLLPVAVVNKYNSRVMELGRDKIGVLTRIKQFRRKINTLNWEARHAELESHHINEYLTDLQLFRVTRNMQQLIRDGELEQEKQTVRAKNKMIF